MYRSDDGTHASQSAGAARQTPGQRARLPMQKRVALLAALASLALGALLAAPIGQPAYAAPARPRLLSCNGPCVGITNPLYTSGGQLVAEGPVGAILTVEGANWPLSTSLTVWPAADAATCAQQAAQPPDDAGQISVDGTGYARGSYLWPTAANSVNQAYILCAVDGTTTVSPDVQANGIDTYTVLAAKAPTLTVSPTTIIQGQPNTLTVSGQNWFAPQQAITVNVCSDALCTAGTVASQIAAATPDGTFQMSITLKADIDPGAYFVEATTANGALKSPPANTPAQLTISAPSPTPTPSPSPSPTPTPTPTTSNGGKGNTTLLIVFLGTFSLLFLIGGIISLAVYMRGSV